MHSEVAREARPEARFISWGWDSSVIVRAVRRHHQAVHQHYHRGDHLRVCWRPVVRHRVCSRPVACLPVCPLPAGFQDGALLKAAVRADEPRGHGGDAAGGANHANRKVRPNRSLVAIHSRTSTSRVRASHPNTSSSGVRPKRTELLRREA